MFALSLFCPTNKSACFHHLISPQQSSKATSFGICKEPVSGHVSWTRVCSFVQMLSQHGATDCIREHSLLCLLSIKCPEILLWCLFYFLQGLIAAQDSL